LLLRIFLIALRNRKPQPQVVQFESALNMFLNYAKTKAAELLDCEAGSAPVEFATIVVAMVLVLLPSMAYYSSQVQKLFKIVAELWAR
jgi:hypothetical protein